MTTFEINLSWEDTERLFYAKEKAGKNDLTGNEYAKEILHRELYRLCPKVPETDDNGNYI
ncbi:MAG: hypothetical protein LUJ25_04595 [Firmicutes bacterium]|nr:hypothetical protein [Bacillota bacterium]